MNNYKKLITLEEAESRFSRSGPGFIRLLGIRGLINIYNYDGRELVDEFELCKMLETEAENGTSRENDLESRAPGPEEVRTNDKN